MTNCFRTPSVEMLSKSVPYNDSFLTTINQDFNVSQMSSTHADALGNLLPFLLCGEESAVHVFYREGRRARQREDSCAREMMNTITGEEKIHEQMLDRVQAELPTSNDLTTIRQRAHDFFVGLASSDPSDHFARVAALDSGVCKIMAALCAGNAIKSCPTVLRIFSKIRSDESRHVRISRKYVLDLGLPVAALSGASEQVCGDLVNLLTPGGKDFEALGVDSDRLFRRIKREEV